jgi:hypothetical protein
LTRIRRVKCDETKPVCVRCTSTGRNCEGFPAPQEQTWEIVTSSTALSILQPSKNPQLKTNGSAECFHFFRHCTISLLSGLFTSEFWDKTILRAAENSDAIRYAAIAVGAAHKSAFHGGTNAPFDAWAAENHDLAVKCLVSVSESSVGPSTDVAIATYLLLACYEVCLDHCDSCVWSG